MNNNNYGGIIGAGVIGIVLIISGAWLPLANDWRWGLILMGVCVILALVAGAVFKFSWVIGVFCAAAALIALLFALQSFSNAISPKPQALIPMLSKWLPL